jgi:hypothetical protein
MLKYKPIDNIQQEIFDCCHPDNDDNTPTGECCYDTWKADLDQVTADWKIAKNCASHKQKEYDYTYAWYQRIKIWCDDWTTTDENADALCRQLELFILHLEKICKVTCKTGEALEILFCMAKDLYMRLDKLKAEYDELTQCINCMKSPELAPGTGIMKYLEEYGKKLDAAIATRNDLIGKIIAALELAYAMDADLCKDFGLEQTLTHWKKVFHCAGCNDNDNDHNQGQIQGSQSGNHCKLEPAISFPLDEDVYYKHLHTQCDDLKQKTEALKAERDKANEKRDALQACKESLETALKQVDPKNKTK